MNKKVLILVNHNVVIYNFRRELVERLVADGYEVYLSCPQGNRIEELVSMGCKFIETEFERHGTSVKEDLRLISFYKKIMKQINPMVVLSYTIKPNIYGGMAAASLNIPYIANITGLGTAVENKGVLQKITKILYKFAFRKVDCVFVQNEENKQFFIDNNIATDKLKLIPGSGVNLSQFTVIDYPENSTEFVFISRIMKEKGIDHYLEMAEYIHKKYEDVKFHICGFCEEDYEEKLKKLEEDGIIKYHGMLSDVRELIKVSSATIHPTYYPEGLSNVLLESCASGRPIITTDRSGCREVVDDGINGYMVEQRNTESLINAVEKFIKLSVDERKQMGLAGRKKVEEEFDRQIVVENYMARIDALSGAEKSEKILV